MSKICKICGKKPVAGQKYKRRGMVRRKGGAGAKIVGKTARRFLPNLQKVRVVLTGTVKRISVCTKCIKSGRIVKA